MFKILEDSARRHNVFISFGPIGREEIKSWMRTAKLAIPSDLVEF
jgi:hypothetical protein